MAERPRGTCGFKGHFVEWRESRIKKLTSILGEEWFNGKEILELACGLGDVGQHFKDLGANVTFAEGHPDYVKQMQANIPDSTIMEIDQDTGWSIDQKFDLIIHWGILYHLDDWTQDLKIAMQHSDLICLESEVCDSDDPYFQIAVSEENWPMGSGGALNGKAWRPSSAYIERIITENGFSFKRYDDADLNAVYHVYDWKLVGTKTWEGGYRRFWVLRKNRKENE